MIQVGENVWVNAVFARDEGEGICVVKFSGGVMLRVSVQDIFSDSVACPLSVCQSKNVKITRECQDCGQWWGVADEQRDK